MSNKIKRILSLEDLVKFCQEQNFEKFNSKESGYKLAVQVPAQFEINSEQNDDSLLFCKVKLMHSGENRNHSSVTDDALVKCSKTLAYKPILANFMEYTDEDTGETLKDFTSHDVEFNDDGSVTYLEKQVGCFTSDEPYFEVEESTGHNFLYGYCAIPKVYTDTYSIIKRKGGTKVSVELEINEMQYSVSNHVLELTDVNILGATLLGKNAITWDNIEEGMKNARLDIADFSTENNSIKFRTDVKLIDLLERIDKKLSNFDNKNPKEGGKEKSMFEKLLEKYGKTVEDITFEYEGLSDEELEAKFLAEFEEGTSTSAPSNGGEGTGEGTQQFENMTRSFELSHSDIRYALYQLLQPFEEADNDWYWISSVYDSYFIYENYNDKIYRQNYTKDNDTNVVAFDGERIELFRELLTASEKAELESMRSNYAVLREFKENTEKNELHTQREELINSEKYSVLAEKNENGEYINAAFAELVKSMDNYSLTDLETQIKVIHSDYISEHSKFTKNTSSGSKTVSMKMFANPNAKKIKSSRYGDLFKK